MDSARSVACELTSTRIAAARSVITALVERPPTHLFFLGCRDEQSSSLASHGEQTLSFYPADDLDNGLIDQRVLKQR